MSEHYLLFISKHFKSVGRAETRHEAMVFFEESGVEEQARKTILSECDAYLSAQPGANIKFVPEDTALDFVENWSFDTKVTYLAEWATSSTTRNRLLDWLATKKLYLRLIMLSH